jgi:GABA permease
MSNHHHHLLIVANETVEGSALVDTVRDIALSHDAEVLVVAPALNSRLRHYMSDSDRAHRAAQRRLAGCLARLCEAGVRANGHVGDADPLRAMEDAMVVFPADEIVIGTHPEERSNWLAHDVVMRACARFGLPVAHVVVDAATHREYLAA